MCTREKYLQLPTKISLPNIVNTDETTVVQTVRRRLRDRVYKDNFTVEETTPCEIQSMTLT